MLDLYDVKTPPAGYSERKGQGALVQLEPLGGSSFVLVDEASEASSRRCAKEKRVIAQFYDSGSGDDDADKYVMADDDEDAQGDEGTHGNDTSLIEVEGYVVSPGQKLNNGVDVEDIFVSLACKGTSGQRSYRVKIRPPAGAVGDEADKHRRYGSLSAGQVRDTIFTCKVPRALIPFCYKGKFLVKSGNMLVACAQLESCVMDSPLPLKYFLRYALRVKAEELNRIWSRCRFDKVWDPKTKLDLRQGCEAPAVQTVGASEDAQRRLTLFTCSVESLIKRSVAKSSTPLLARNASRSALMSYVLRVSPLCDVSLTWADKNMSEAARLIMLRAPETLCRSLTLPPFARLYFSPEAVNFFASPEKAELEAIFPTQDYLLNGLGVFHLMALHRSLFYANGKKREDTGESYLSPAYCACIPELASICPSSLRDIMPSRYMSSYQESLDQISAVGKTTESKVSGEGKKTPTASDDGSPSDIEIDDDDDHAPCDESDRASTGNGTNVDIEDDDEFRDIWDMGLDTVSEQTVNWAGASMSGESPSDELDAEIASIAEALEADELDQCMLEAVGAVEQEAIAGAEDVDWDDLEETIDLEQTTTPVQPTETPVPVPLDMCSEAIYKAANLETLIEERQTEHPTHTRSSLLGHSMADVMMSYPECPERTTVKSNGYPSKNPVYLKLGFSNFVKLAIKYKTSCVSLQEIVDLTVLEQINAYRGVGHTVVPYPVLETRLLQVAGFSITSEAALENGAVSEETLSVFGSTHERYGKGRPEFMASFREALDHFGVSTTDYDCMTARIALAVARLGCYGTLVAAVADAPLKFDPSELVALLTVFSDARRFFEGLGLSVCSYIMIVNRIVASTASIIRSRLAFSILYTRAAYRHEQTITRAVDKIYKRSISLRSKNLAAKGIDIDNLDDELGTPTGVLAPGVVPDERRLPPADLDFTPFARLAIKRGWSHEVKMRKAAEVNAFLRNLLEEERINEEEALRTGNVPEPIQLYESESAKTLPSNRQWILDQVVQLNGGRRPVAMLEHPPSAEQISIMRQMENGVPFVVAMGAGGGGKSCAPANIIGAMQPGSVLCTGFMHTQISNIKDRMSTGDFPYPGTPPCLVCHQVIVSHCRTCDGVGGRLRPSKKKADLEGERSVPFFCDVDCDHSHASIGGYCPFNKVQVVFIDEICTMPIELWGPFLDVLSSSCFKSLRCVVFVGDPLQLQAVSGGGIGNILNRAMGPSSFGANRRSKTASGCASVDALRHRERDRFVYEEIVPADVPGPMDAISCVDEQRPIYPARIVACKQVLNHKLPSSKSLKTEVDCGLEILERLKQADASLSPPDSSDSLMSCGKRVIDSADATVAGSLAVHKKRQCGSTEHRVSELALVDPEVAHIRPLSVSGGRSTAIEEVDLSTGMEDIDMRTSCIVPTSFSKPQTEGSLLDLMDESSDGCSGGQGAVVKSSTSTDTFLQDETSQLAWRDASTASGAAEDSTAGSSAYGDDGAGSDFDFDDFYGDDSWESSSTTVMPKSGTSSKNRDGIPSFIRTSTVQARQTGDKPSWWDVLIEHASRGIINQETLMVFRSNAEVRLARNVVRPFFANGLQELSSGYFRGERCMFRQSFLDMGLQNRLVVRVIAEPFFKYMYIDQKTMFSLVSPLVKDMLTTLSETIAKTCAQIMQEPFEGASCVTETALRRLKCSMGVDTYSEAGGSGNHFDSMITFGSSVLFKSIEDTSEAYGLDTAEIARIYLTLAADWASFKPAALGETNAYVPENVCRYVANNLDEKLSSLSTNKNSREAACENDANHSNDTDMADEEDDVTFYALLRGELVGNKLATLYMDILDAAVYGINRSFSRRFNARQQRALERGNFDHLVSAPIDDPVLRPARSVTESIERGGSALVYPIKREVMDHVVRRSRIIYSEKSLKLNKETYLAPLCEQRYLNAIKSVSSIGSKRGPTIGSHHVSVVLFALDQPKFMAGYFPATDVIRRSVSSPCFRTYHSAQSHDAPDVYVILPPKHHATPPGIYTAFTRYKNTVTVLGTCDAFKKAFDFGSAWTFSEEQTGSRRRGKNRGPKLPSAPDLAFACTPLANRLRRISLHYYNDVYLRTDMHSVLKLARFVHSKREAPLVPLPEDEAWVNRDGAICTPEDRILALRDRVVSRAMRTARREPILTPLLAPLQFLSSRGDVITSTMIDTLSYVGDANGRNVCHLQFLPADPTVIPRGSSAHAFPMADMQDQLVKCRTNTDSHWIASRLFPSRSAFTESVTRVIYGGYHDFGQRHLDGIYA